MGYDVSRKYAIVINMRALLIIIKILYSYDWAQISAQTLQAFGVRELKHAHGIGDKGAIFPFS